MTMKPEIRIDKNITPFESDDNEKIREKCRDEISMATDGDQSTALITSVKLSEKPSENFVKINAQLSLIMDHLRSDSFPESICILCPDDETMKEYMVVFNFYYAESKADRMNDDRWD